MTMRAAFFCLLIFAAGLSAQTPTAANPDGKGCTVGTSPNLLYTASTPNTTWQCVGPQGPSAGVYQRYGASQSPVPITGNFGQPANRIFGTDSNGSVGLLSPSYYLGSVAVGGVVAGTAAAETLNTSPAQGLNQTAGGTVFVDGSSPSKLAFYSALSNATRQGVSIDVVGDSFSAGNCAGAVTTSNCWVTQFISYMQNAYGGNGSGLIAVSNSNYWTTNSTSFNGYLGPVQCWFTSAQTLTLNGQSVNLNADSSTTPCATASTLSNLYSIAPGQTLTFGTSGNRLSGTTLKIYYAIYGDTSQGFGVSIDGGGSTTVGASTAGSWTAQVASVASTAGQHYVTFTPPASGHMYIYGAKWVGGGTGVSVDNWSRGGCMSSCVGEYPAISLAWVPLDTVPNLVIIPLGINDAINGQSATVYQQQMQNIVSYFQALSPSPAILLVDQSQLGGSNAAKNAAQLQLRTAMQSLAVNNGCSFVSIGESWGPWANANAYGLEYASDTTHPSDSGHSAIAALIESATNIAPPPVPAYTLDQIGNPAVPKTFNVGNQTPLTYTFGAATGSGLNMFTIQDTAGNTGTGGVLVVNRNDSGDIIKAQYNSSTQWRVNTGGQNTLNSLLGNSSAPTASVTGTGCTLGTVTGNNIVGKIAVTGTGSACAITLTWATGPSYTAGSGCPSMQDSTSGVQAVESSDSTTTAVFAALAITNGDTLRYGPCAGR